MLKHPCAIARMVEMTVGGSVAVNTFSVQMPEYLVKTAGLSAGEATWISAALLVAFMAMQPLVERSPNASDASRAWWRSASPARLQWYPCCCCGRARSPVEASALVVAGLAITTGYSANNAVVKAELFPVHARAVGVGVPHAIVVALVGGTSEYLGLLFKRAGHEEWFYYYIAAMIFVSLLFYLCLPETRPTGPDTLD